MRRRTMLAAAGVAAAGALAAGGVAWATSSGGEPALSGDVKAKAVEAALAHVGGGTVIETEAGDDGAFYGVEIRLAGGRTVEVALDESFAVIGEAADDDGQDEASGADDD